MGFIIGGLFILVAGQIYILWRLIENHERRIDQLMKYIKPDTTMKIKGIDEVKKTVQQILNFEKDKQRNKIDIEKEISMINKIGV